MRKVVVFIAAILIVSCAKLEFEDAVDAPIGFQESVPNVVVNTEVHECRIHSLHFFNKNTGKRCVKFRKELNEPRWYYQEIDSVEDYKVLSDAAHPYLMQDNYELGELKSSFIYDGDTIRIHRCGDYPKENPKYSLLVVTVTEGELK